MPNTLKWNKANYPTQTYRARLGNLTFTIDCIGSEQWRLRGWTDGKFSTYKTGPTMAAVKALAQSIADNHAT
jgi:hypothetical protein